ncbi:unnamed protein product [Citrullus colocynthis]|uniref:ABC-2 type transporter domain-containing protein n=1 Tax=Citrullus colocynthis TaxID=252529 RepID=A0ABP0YQQ5_9ROSI
MFRMIALVNQHVVASTLSSFVILQILIFGGFIITHPSVSPWLQWGFWLSPISYGEIGLSINEFLAPTWQKGSNSTIGHVILESRGLDYHQYFYWISLAALFGFALALTFLNSPGSSPAIISYEKLSQSNCNGGANSVQNPLSSPKTSIESTKGNEREGFYREETPASF